MKLILASTLLLSLSFAAPLPQTLDIAHEIPEPAMTRNGIVVAFDQAEGMGTKRSLSPSVASFLERIEKRGDTIPAMTVGGAVVPFENDGAGDMGTKRDVEEKRGDTIPAMTVGGSVVPYENDGASDMGT